MCMFVLVWQIVENGQGLSRNGLNEDVIEAESESLKLLQEKHFDTEQKIEPS